MATPQPVMTPKMRIIMRYEAQMDKLMLRWGFIGAIAGIILALLVAPAEAPLIGSIFLGMGLGGILGALASLISLGEKMEKALTDYYREQQDMEA